MPHYFSYGSNMDPAQLRSRCPSAILLGPAALPDYQLSFTLFSQTRQCGCPDILPITDPEKRRCGDAAALSSPRRVPPSADCGVWGALYTLSDADLLQLDLYEGVPRQKYRRISVHVLDPSGALVPSETYDVLHKSPTFQKPSRAFLAQLIASAEKLPLPAAYLAKLRATPTCD
jgi:hypothetical protein